MPVGRRKSANKSLREIRKSNHSNALSAQRRKVHTKRAYKKFRNNPYSTTPSNPYGRKVVNQPNKAFNPYVTNNTPEVINNVATQLPSEIGNPQRLYSISGTPQQMYNQIMSIPGARETATRLGITYDTLIHNITGAGSELMGWSSTRFPGCGGSGVCGGSGLCVGLGCMDKCKGVGSSSNQMNWSGGGGFGDGNPNTNWHFDIQANSGGGGSLNCQIGVTW